MKWIGRDHRLGGSRVPIIALLIFHGGTWVSGGEIALGAYDVGTLGCEWAVIAYDVNDSGTVVGVSGFDCDENGHGFSWNNGVMTDLSVMSGKLHIDGADGISRFGDVMTGYGDAYYNMGYLDRDGHFIFIDPPEGCELNNHGEGMNSSGTMVVGSCIDDIDLDLTDYQSFQAAFTGAITSGW